LYLYSFPTRRSSDLKYFDGEIPAYQPSETAVDKDLEKFMQETVTNVEDKLDEMEFSIALSSIWQLISRTNKYIDKTEPWVLAKDPAQKERFFNIMAHLVESLRTTAIILQ